MKKCGVVCDIDGVLWNGGKNHPIPGAAQAIAILQEHNIPIVYVTNGGGKIESGKASDLSYCLQTQIDSAQVITSHTPMMRIQSENFSKSHVLIVGFDSVSAAEIATFYGFEDFTTLDDYISSHLYLVPFTRHFTQASLPKHDRPISAIFMVHEPVYWAEGLQVLCDVLLSADGVIKPEGYTMGKEQTIPFFVANPDFVYPASFAVPRFTSGAFSSCLADLYKGHTGKNLNVTYYGKPIASIYTYAKEVLEKQANQELQRIYCIGDNPLSDIKGANEAPGPEGFWFSMLVTTGCWKGEIHENDPQNPAKFVSNDVLKAVQFILKQ